MIFTWSFAKVADIWSVIWIFSFIVSWTLTTLLLPRWLRRFDNANDIHFLCVVCRGVDCDTDDHCPECADMGDVAMTNYVKHKLSLQRKLQSKRKLKETVSVPSVAVDSAGVAEDVAVSDQPSSPNP